MKGEKAAGVSVRAKKSIADYSVTYRLTKNKKLEDLKERFPELSSEISASCGTRTGAGRPRIEEQCPLLLKTIVDMVAPEASADIGRRSELLRACTTVDDLKKELE